jgi:hypothetical protein
MPDVVLDRYEISSPAVRATLGLAVSDHCGLNSGAGFGGN